MDKSPMERRKGVCMNNILFFLTPKALCAFLQDDYTIRQALERMEATGYAALPILNKRGEYRGVLTEGDLLPGEKDNIYINTNQGWFKPCKDLGTFLEEYSMAGGTHHSAMVYGADIRELAAFGRMMGFEVIIID